MQLDRIQKKIVESKPSEISLINGVSSTGKSTIAVYRALYLKNYYCLYQEDRVLIAAKNSERLNDLRELYTQIESENRLQYITLFSEMNPKVEILTFNDIISSYANKFIAKHGLSYKNLINKEARISLIIECTNELINTYPKSKLLDCKYIKFLEEEISWIKSAELHSLEEYQGIDRIGRKYGKGLGPVRLLKASKERKIIFDLVTSYNSKLKSKNLYDKEDLDMYAFEQAMEVKNNYTHIIIDESQELTKRQLSFVLALNSQSKYSSTTLLADRSKTEALNSWMIKGRKISAFNLGYNVRSFRLSKIYKITGEQEIGEIVMEKNYRKISSIENYEYCDIKHGRNFKFLRDLSNISEVIVNHEDKSEDTYSSDELMGIPVFSDIAAGEPIYINDEIDSNFYIPKYWLKGSNDCFILKVKGSSMVGANIEDGDFVLIRKQYTAQNGDIVAADLNGSATLKRLNINKEGIMLMPENERYSPILVEDGNMSILGIAVGIIKHKQ